MTRIDAINFPNKVSGLTLRKLISFIQGEKSGEIHWDFRKSLDSVEFSWIISHPLFDYVSTAVIKYRISSRCREDGTSYYFLHDFRSRTTKDGEEVSTIIREFENEKVHIRKRLR